MKGEDQKVKERLLFANAIEPQEIIQDFRGLSSYGKNSEQVFDGHLRNDIERIAAIQGYQADIFPCHENESFLPQLYVKVSPVSKSGTKAEIAANDELLKRQVDFLTLDNC